MTTKKTTTPTEGTQETVSLADVIPDGSVKLEGVVDNFEAEWTHPLTLIQEALSAPFPQELVSYRDGPYNKATKQKDQLRYVNVNHYEDRLNDLAFGHWSSSEPKIIPAQRWATDYDTKEKYLEHGFVVTETVTIHGVTHGGTSDFETMVTAGYAAAFKRACLKFGLGRELYEKEEVTTNPIPSSQQNSSAARGNNSGTTPPTAPARSDGGYPRPTEGQRGFLMKLGVPQSLIEQHDGAGNYTITGNIGRDLIDNLKDGDFTVVDALAKHGIQMPVPARPSDGLPVRSTRR